MPTGQQITLLEDRGFVHEQLIHYLRKQRWHFRLRLPGETLVHREARPASAVQYQDTALFLDSDSAHSIWKHLGKGHDATLSCCFFFPLGPTLYNGP
jgi:hypothetical protein